MDLIDEMYEEKERGEDIEVIAHLNDKLEITHYTSIEAIA